MESLIDSFATSCVNLVKMLAGQDNSSKQNQNSTSNCFNLPFGSDKTEKETNALVKDILTKMDSNPQRFR